MHWDRALCVGAGVGLKCISKCKSLARHSIYEARRVEPRLSRLFLLTNPGNYLLIFDSCC